MRAIIAYDVSDARRRSKVIDLLEGHGERIQESVFDVSGSQAQLKRLMGDIGGLVDINVDVGHFFPLCRDCFGQTRRIPVLPPGRDASRVIVV